MFLYCLEIGFTLFLCFEVRIEVSKYLILTIIIIQILHILNIYIYIILLFLYTSRLSTITIFFLCLGSLMTGSTVLLIFDPNRGLGL